MRTLGPRLAAALCAAVALLSGCGGNPEPAPAPAPPKTPSPTASASPSPPVMPEAARARTKAGSEALVRHFLQAMAYAGATGDTAPFLASYTRECTRCAAITKGIEKTYADGGSITGGDWIPRRFRFYGIRNGISYIDAVVDYAPQTWIKDSSGRKTTAPARSNVLKTFQLSWRDERWLVGALDPEA